MLTPRAPVSPQRTTWIEIEPFDAAKIEKKIKANAEALEINHERIVQTRRGEIADKAAPDAFLGEKTRVVERQTVSRDRQTAMGADSSPKPAARAQAKSNRADSKSSPRLDQLGLAMIPSPKSLAEQEEDPFQDRIANQGSTGMPKDYVKGFKESESTALNTQEFVFYGYFQRIRQRLDLSWSSTLREHLVKLYRGGRRLASEMDHTTKVLVTLDSVGEVTRVEIVEASGTRTLDDAATRAFNQAGPFPNPPKGILNAEGKIKIRWDFVLRT